MLSNLVFRRSDSFFLTAIIVDKTAFEIIPSMSDLDIPASDTSGSTVASE